MNDNPLDRLARLQRLLADEQRQPIKDDAGIIIPSGIDAAHRAAGMRRLLSILNTEPQEVTPCQKPL